MGLKENIEQDVKEAMRARDGVRLSVLRMLLSAIHNRGIEKRATKGVAELAPEEVVAVLRSEVKKRRDSIAEFEKGGRSDLVRKETQELAILERYLPPEMTDDAIRAIVQKVVERMGPVTPKEFGKVMSEVMKEVGGQASGNRVSRVVQRALSS